MRACILDSGSLGPDIDLAPLLALPLEWSIWNATTPAEIATRIAGATIVLSNKVNLQADLLSQAADLRYISVLATGTNNVDLTQAEARGIAVSNVRNYSTDAVVQHTLSLILALATNLLSYHDDVQRQRWQQSPFFCFFNQPIADLCEKNLTIVGYGHQGRKLAVLAQALGMQVRLATRPGDLASARDGFPCRPFSELLPTTDILSFHCPLNAETKGLLNIENIFTLKPGAVVINCARGGLVEESALAAALQQGHLSGAGVDVATVEPPGLDHPLMTLKHPNFILTPHIAWASIASRRRLVAETAENIQAFLRGELRNCVTAGSALRRI